MSRRLGLIFPGQGSQKVGMGRTWAESSPAARAVFAMADEALGEDLTALCWEGPDEQLQLTANTQPAILTTSIAIYRAVAERLPSPVVLAGHSLGEYSALVAAGSLDFADAVRLVRTRGELMQRAVPAGKGAMAAVLGLDAETVAAIAAEASTGDGICAVANLNSPEQTVVAGERQAVERAVEIAGERGAKRAVLLPVSAPFHSPLMRPAAEGLAPVLGETPFADPQVPVVTNVDAAPVGSGEAARAALGRQVEATVRWVESVRYMTESAGVEVFAEVGPGNVLTGLNRRIVSGPKTVSLAEPDRLNKLEEALST